MLNTPTLQQHYIGNEQQLLKDILQFFMHGIAYQKRKDENVLPSKTWTLKPNLFKVQIFYRQILLELKHYIFKLIVLNTTSEKIGMLKPKHSIYDNSQDIKILVKKSEYYGEEQTKFKRYTIKSLICKLDLIIKSSAHCILKS